EFQIGYAPPIKDTVTRYLQSRNYNLERMEKGGLVLKREQTEEYIDRFRDRIMFPIHNARGQVIGFAGRSLDANVEPKYLNTPETILFRKSQQLYNFHRAKAEIRKKQTVVLFEGYVDVIKAWE